MTVPVVHEPGGGEGAVFGTVRFAIKADSDATQGAYSLVEASGPVFATPHVHHDREEAFFVIEGNVTFLAGEGTVEGSPGSFVLVPRETMHAFRSNGDSRLIIIHSPGGFEEFFRKAAAAIGRGEFDVGFRDRLAKEVGVTYHDDVTF
jgi:mannose-6-phosphate isomerase-like protein (cupin superfamily)